MSYKSFSCIYFHGILYLFPASSFCFRCFHFISLSLWPLYINRDHCLHRLQHSLSQRMNFNAKLFRQNWKLQRRFIVQGTSSGEVPNLLSQLYRIQISCVYNTARKQQQLYFTGWSTQMIQTRLQTVGSLFLTFPPQEIFLKHFVL